MTGWYNSSWRARFLEYRKEGDGWSHPLLLCDKTHRRRTMMSGDDRQNSPSISRQNRPSATGIIPDKSKQECTFLKGTILLESSKMRYTGANNERFCKQWKGISFCPPPLMGRLAEVYPFPLVGEFPKPPTECWRNSDRTPHNCGGYASLIKEKTGSWALCHGFRFP